MDDRNDLDEFEYEFDELLVPDDAPEDDLPVEKGTLRLKSIILLSVFIIPTLIIVIELLTGGVSGVISPSTIKPIITPDQLPAVHF